MPRTSSPLTFASFNNLAKLSDATLDLYGRVLASVPGSRLMLKGKGLGDDTVRTRVLSRLDAFNIAPDRVLLRGHTKTTPEHLSLYNEVDIALDPFPYHGTTTTCEALWMGVPVITLAGPVHASRVGVSLLHATKLSDLIADTPDDYIRIAAALAADQPRRVELRATLRDRLKASPLCDAASYTRKLEAAYRDMWRSWCGPVKDPATPAWSAAKSAPAPETAAPASKPGLLGRLFGGRKP